MHVNNMRHSAAKDLRACKAGAALAVAHVGLDGADEQGILLGAAAVARVPGLQGAQLLAIARHLCSTMLKPPANPQQLQRALAGKRMQRWISIKQTVWLSL